MSEYEDYSTEELNEMVCDAIRANDRVVIAELTIELRNRLRAA